MASARDDCLARVIRAVCSIPAEFRRAGDVTEIQLVRRSGYQEVRDEVDVTAIADYLREHLGVIDEWQVRSWDKRTPSGWYLDGCSVGFHDKNLSAASERSYPDRATACAHFILNELDEMIHASLGKQEPEV